MTVWIQSVSLSIDNLRRICQTVPMTQPDRHDTILNAAFQAFASYGYKRASMDDIARGAGLSRTALYLSYRNKEDIFRSLAVRYFDEAMVAMRAALQVRGTEAALMGAFIAKDGKFMEAVLNTPHGAELMDAGFSITGDVAAEAEDQMAAVLADWLAQRVLPQGLGSARDVADVIMAAHKGLKTCVKTMDALRAGEARLARLMAMALGG
jgi:AcrR family transcriptional regulator